MQNKTRQPGPIARYFNKQVDKAVSKYLTYFHFTPYGNVKGTSGEYLKGQKTSAAYEEELYVYGCISLIANKIAAIPLRLYQDEQKKKVVDNHGMNKLMKKPNFKDSWYDIKESIAANLEADGNAFVAVGEGVPESIYSLCANKVRIVPTEKKSEIREKEDWIKGYEYGARTKDLMYKPDEVLHEHKFSISDDYRGMSPIRAAALNISVTQEAKRQNYNFFNSGMHYDQTFESDQPFDKIQYDRLRQDLHQRSQGTEHAHEPFILFSGLKMKSEGISARDIEYIAGLKLNREEICGFVYQVPIILLSILENSSYNNIKEAQAILYEFCIKPRLVKNRELYQKISDRYPGAQVYVDFDLSDIAVLQEDQLTKVQKAKELWSMGVSVKTLNEMYNLGIQEFDGWDVGYLPFNLMPVGQVGQAASSEPEPPEKPAATEPPEKRVKTSKDFWTEDRKVVRWKMSDSIANRAQSKYKSELVPYFKAQKKEVLANLNKYKAVTYEKIQENTFALIGEDVAGQKAAISADSVLFDSKEQIDKLKKISAPHYRQVIKDQGEATMELLGKKSVKRDSVFDIDVTRVTDWIKKHALENARSITKTIKKKLTAELVEAVNEGESIPDIQERISAAYEGYTELRGYETERIARTEIISASNQGNIEAYRQGDVKKKAWLSTRDGRVRDHHLALEDKYQDGIPIEENFVNDFTGGSGIAPGQLGLPEDDINCRCDTIPIIEED